MHKFKVYIAIRDRINDWYNEKYGEKAIKNPDINDPVSYVFFAGNPIQLTIPTIIARPSKKPHESWVIFPSGVMRNEDTLRYVDDQYLLRALTDVQKKSIKGKIDKNIRKIRRISLNLEFSDIPESEKQKKDIMQHMYIVVRNICNEYNRGVSIAIWEMFFAVELSVKLLWMDKNRDKAFGHDIKKIISKMNDQERIPLEDAVFYRKFPSFHDCIKYRYSEKVIKNIEIVNKYYNYTLDYLVIITSLLTHKLYYKKNPAILLRDPRTL